MKWSELYKCNKQMVILFRQKEGRSIEIPAVASFYTWSVMHVTENNPATSHLWHVITHSMAFTGDETSGD